MKTSIYNTLHTHQMGGKYSGKYPRKQQYKDKTMREKKRVEGKEKVEVSTHLAPGRGLRAHQTAGEAASGRQPAGSSACPASGRHTAALGATRRGAEALRASGRTGGAWQGGRGMQALQMSPILISVGQGGGQEGTREGQGALHDALPSHSHPGVCVTRESRQLQAPPPPQPSPFLLQLRSRPLGRAAAFLGRHKGSRRLF